MKKLMAGLTMATAMAYAIFWVGFNGNMYGPFHSFGDCQSWSSYYQMYSGSCQYRMY